MCEDESTYHFARLRRCGKKLTFSSAAPRFCGRGEVIFATILRKQFPSDREGGAGPRRQATNGGPHLWHRSDGKLEVTARAECWRRGKKRKNGWRSAVSASAAKRRGEKRGLPRRSPILVLLSSKQA